MFDKLKKWLSGDNDPAFEKPAEKPKVEKKPKQVKEKKEVSLSAKEQATANNEPYIAILKVDVDPNNINSGSFELDWNDKFVINLTKAGYKIKATDTDAEIVDRWFQTVCRNIALEIYEQEDADPSKRNDVRVIQSKDIGNGRSEVS
jgi:hypothetical protein